mmetsp:Transcript_4215/g.6573  ORF Transcript_4215/g.6573 Transcript_4215/m.6573 type:complete len:210 (+) Transcript_4215:43-672(+)
MFLYRCAFVIVIFTLGFLANAKGFTPPPVGSAFLASSTKLSFSASSTEIMPEVKVGDELPSILLTEGQADYGKPLQVDLKNLVAGKKVAIFAVPGAFTPGCSKSHLPSFITAQDDLKSKGVELTICVATNDAYVMEAWGRTSGGADAGIRFLSDSNAELTKALGLAMETPNGIRTKRFSLIANDGKVTHYFSSAEESSNTWAPSVLSSL